MLFPFIFETTHYSEDNQPSCTRWLHIFGNQIKHIPFEYVCRYFCFNNYQDIINVLTKVHPKIYP